MKAIKAFRNTGASIVAAALLGGCQAELPEPESPAAVLYRTRCTDGCHRLYQPGSMTAAMWEIQVERMQREFRRIGKPPLTDAETALLLAYLSKYGLRPPSEAPGGGQNPGRRPH